MADVRSSLVPQLRSQKILLGSAFEEKVDLLIQKYSPGTV